MRLERSDSADPWPPQMTITIAQRAEPLLRLLFAREVWGFAPHGAPGLDPVPAPGSSRRPPGLADDDALARWADDWEIALQRYDPVDTTPREPDAETRQALATLTDEQLVEWVSARDSRFWHDGIDDTALDEWSASLAPDRSVPVERTPERMSLPALVEAWRTGITTVVELPFDGYVAERRGRTTLIVSAITRRTPDLYARALREAARI